MQHELHELSNDQPKSISNFHYVLASYFPNLLNCSTHRDHHA